MFSVNLFVIKVWPITTFFDQQVNQGSKRLVDEHSNKWPSKRILLQVNTAFIYPLGGAGIVQWQSARFPPMWPGFSPGSRVFLHPQEPTLLNSNSIGISGATGLSVIRLLRATLVKHSRFFFIYWLGWIK